MDRRLSSAIKPKKFFGQNFLNGPEGGKFLQALATAAEIGPEDTVLEIGPGLGALTKILSERAKKVIAVEIDPELLPTLRENLRARPNVEIVNADILKLLTSNFQFPEKNLKVTGSIPYQITSPLLHELMARQNWQIAALLVQKEVAEKISAVPPRASYLANFIRTFVDVKLVAVVPKAVFWPVPKVDGAIVQLKIKNSKLKIGVQPWSRFLHWGFTHQRQMLNKVFPAAVLEAADIDPHRRPATLSLTEWQHVFDANKKYGQTNTTHLPKP